MSFLLSVNNLSKSFGVKVLFERISFGIAEKDRVGLIGPNGAGKTTLLKILAGQEKQDSGELAAQRGLKLGYLAQNPDLREAATVLEIVHEGISHGEDWERDVLAQKYIAQCRLDGDAKIAELSGGWKKKVALARELAKEPDVLFLDEPTNHLDVESILWLEKRKSSLLSHQLRLV